VCVCCRAGYVCLTETPPSFGSSPHLHVVTRADTRVACTRTEERVRLEVRLVFTRAMQPLPQQMVQVPCFPLPAATRGLGLPSLM
jgi:hypothetical protein